MSLSLFAILTIMAAGCNLKNNVKIDSRYEKFEDMVAGSVARFGNDLL